CIYIDPPYNTGNEGWKYNDNVNSPTQKAWLNKVVDKDCQDKHDRWLSMMTPRLKLLKELLRDDGAIFISIDDNEVAHLRMLMNEIFGEDNFVAQFIWQKRVTRENRTDVSVTHEYVLLYSKKHDFSSDSVVTLMPMDEAAISRYKNPDNDPRGPWTSVPVIAQAGHGTKSQFYTLLTPKGRKIDPPSGSCWRYTKEKMDIEIKKNNIWFGSDGNGVPRIKKFLNQGRQGLTPLTILEAKLIGSTDQAKREIVELFEGESIFETPKPVGLIRHLLQITTSEDDIILDSFAGSGTTAHAVLLLNKEDEGNRKFILIQCDETDTKTGKDRDISDKITAERVRRVITGVKTAKDQDLKKGLGGSFTYYELGESFDEEKFLSGKNLPKYNDMAGFVWSTLTGNSIDEKKIKEKKQYIGETNKFEVYLIYEPDREKLKKNVALTMDWLKKLPEWDGKKKRLIFAPVKWMSSDVLYEYGVEYVQLPYEIYRRIEKE
ncbi:MAG: site-specific DNA-methyltransferase, partial [Bacteroidota bacterium]|nr:site-specific DNA-methyltransferase [Bacteroidota bacterium]